MLRLCKTIIYDKEGTDTIYTNMQYNFVHVDTIPSYFHVDSKSIVCLVICHIRHSIDICHQLCQRVPDRISKFIQEVKRHACPIVIKRLESI